MNSSEYSHHTQASEIEAICDHILIDGLDTFAERKVNGIILPGENETERGIRPRWARVCSTGPDQDSVNVGDWVLVKHGSWTRGTLINGKIYRRVDPKEIYLVSEEQPEGVLI